MSVPYNLEAEVSILGNFIDKPELFSTYRKNLSQDDFFAPGPRNIFRVLCDIVYRGEVIRLETINLLIEKDDVGALADAVSKCRNSETDFAADLKTVLRDSARRRRLAEIESEREKIINDPDFLTGGPGGFPPAAPSCSWRPLGSRRAARHRQGIKPYWRGSCFVPVGQGF